MKILFVCRGNVGRSQIAEALLIKLVGDTHVVISAGTSVRDKEGNSRQGEKLKDREGAANIVTVMAEMGIDVKDKQRDQLSESMVEQADIIISMAEKESMPEYLFMSTKVKYWEFPDPKGAGLDEVREMRDSILKKVEELALELR
jgi:arsenate reductase (thioredoxin)